MKFCDYCTCSDCQNGAKYLSHAYTANKNFICDVCYSYDVCPNGPCDDMNCEHRPIIISKWSK